MKMERGNAPAADLNGLGQCGRVESEEEDQDYHLFLESDSNVSEESVELDDKGAPRSGQMVSGGATSASGGQQQEQGSQQQHGNQPRQGSQPPEKGEEVCNACIRAGCPNQAVPNSEWEDEYCSNECVVSHCRDVFASWVSSNKGSAQSYNAVK